jgi:hypothetical protein
VQGVDRTAKHSGHYTYAPLQQPLVQFGQRFRHTTNENAVLKWLAEDLKATRLADKGIHASLPVLEEEELLQLPQPPMNRAPSYLR